MSHIPAAAMPHAQAHHAEPAAAPAPVPVGPRREPTPAPWMGWAIGGAVAIGGALTAAWLLRGDKKPPRKSKGKGGRPKGATGKRRASRAARPADA